MSRVVVFETVRRHLTSVLVIVFLGLLLILGLASSRFERPSMWLSFVTLLAIAAGAGLIGPEFSSGTLQLILVKPINRAVYLVSRVTGVLLFVTIAALLAFAGEVTGRLLWGGRELIDNSAILLVNTLSEAAMICALLALFGSFLRSYFHVALYFLIQIVLTVIQGILGAMKLAREGLALWITQFIERHPIVLQALAWVERNLFPEAPQTFDRDWLLMVWSNVLIAIVLACFLFRNREVPYGAD